MRASKRLHYRGFTLVELMITIGIIGVLAALAVYGVRRYLLHSKTVEVKNALGQMAKDAKTAYERESMASKVLAGGGTVGVASNLCLSASASVPASMAAVQGQKYQSNDAEWQVDVPTPGKGFACLRFQISDPQYYCYSYMGTSGATGIFTAVAWGDLNGDATTSTFTLAGALINSVVQVSPNFGEVDPEQ